MKKTPRKNNVLFVALNVKPVPWKLIIVQVAREEKIWLDQTTHSHVLLHKIAQSIIVLNVKLWIIIKNIANCAIKNIMHLVVYAIFVHFHAVTVHSK